MQLSMSLIQVCLYQKVHKMAKMVTCGQRALEGSSPVISWHSPGQVCKLWSWEENVLV